MKYINTFSDNVQVSQVALGCMRIANQTETEVDRYLISALEYGTTISIMQIFMEEMGCVKKCSAKPSSDIKICGARSSFRQNAA